MKRWRPSTGDTLKPGDVVGLGIHTGNALRGYELGTEARERGAIVVYGGIHATLYPEEAQSLGGAHAVVKGDGDQCGRSSSRTPRAGRSSRSTRRDGRRRPVRRRAVGPAARGPLHVGLGADRPRLPEALLVLLGLAHRRPEAAATPRRRRRRRDRRAPPPRVPLRRARRRQLLSGHARPISRWPNARTTPPVSSSCKALRAERFELMEKLAELPSDMVFFTQITMEAAEDDAFLDAMRRAHIKGALVGVEAVTPEGLKDVYKGFNDSGEALVTRLRIVPRARRARPRLVHLRAAKRSPGDVRGDGRHRRPRRPDLRAVRDADALPRHHRLRGVGKEARQTMPPQVGGIPVTRHWLIPQAQRPKVYTPHPVMSARRDSRADAGGVGPVLQPAARLGPLALPQSASARGWPSC